MPKEHLYIIVFAVLVITFVSAYVSISSDKEAVLSSSSFGRLSYSPEWEDKRRAEVRAVQQRLKELGYDCGNADGVWGESTELAIKAFQRDKQLVADGLVGPATRKALKVK